MAISQNFPNVWPSLVLDFENSKTLDPRITFTRSSTATYVDSNGIIQTAAADEARFDHDPETGESLGLLIEEQRTNSVRTSNLITSSLISPYGTTLDLITSGVPTPPTGENIYKLPTGAAYRIIGTNGNSTGGTSGVNTWTYSIFVYPFDGITSVNLNSHFGGQTTFNLSTLTVSGSYSGTITKFSNGWWRLSYTRSYSSSTDLGLTIPSGSTGQYYFSSAQIEVGSFPTSYIPTSGSTATRTVDSASITGSNFSSWYNQSEGTIISSFLYNTFNNSGLTGNPVVWQLKKSSGTGWAHGILHTNDSRLRWRDDGGGAISLSSFPYNQNYASVKSAFAYTTTNRYAIANGLTQVTSSSYTQNNTYGTFLIGGSQAWSQYGSLNRPISRIVYYPTRLTDTQLQNLTK